ncbi:hypothetical protein [Paraburkholderia unamae]|uniref:Uncharacterized protein n=1 Tax=Paraburkholderia unamae TaxID=219649 RepID=A0ACC6RWK6_9BURK
MKPIDAAGDAKHATARVRKLHATQKEPADAADPASVEAHQKELDGLDIDVIVAVEHQ